MAMTRVVAVMRLRAVPAPAGTTTAIFQVNPATATPLAMVAPEKPLGPEMMSTSLPAAASVRHSLSKFAHTP